MNEREIFDAIKRNVLDLVPEVDANAISADCTLSDLGLNSIDRADVVSLTMEQLGIAVPVHEFHRGDTIGTLVSTMRRHA
jgi:polyketide biosynthesis acyl carrier protein